MKDLLPKPAKTGRKRKDDRMVLNGIIYFLSTAIRWNDMPKYYPSGVTCWRRLKTWDRLGVWEKLQEELLLEMAQKKKLNLKTGYLDSSFAPTKKGAKMR